jgi:hypothetical protein
LTEIKTQPQISRPIIVDLNQWFMAADESNAGSETVNDIGVELGGEEPALEAAAGAEEVPSHERERIQPMPTQQRAPMPWLGQATSTTQLVFEFT